MGNANKKQVLDPVPKPFVKKGEVNFVLSDQGQKIVEDIVNKKKEEQSHILHVSYEEYEYPFENMAFEGGGTKGGVYAGVVKVS